jgi:hypothetical protein
LVALFEYNRDISEVIYEMPKMLLPKKLWCHYKPCCITLGVPFHLTYSQEAGSHTHRHLRLLSQKGILSPGYYYEGKELVMHQIAI